jgi:hypothetical protein
LLAIPQRRIEDSHHLHRIPPPYSYSFQALGLDIKPSRRQKSTAA